MPKTSFTSPFPARSTTSSYPSRTDSRACLNRLSTASALNRPAGTRTVRKPSTRVVAGDAVHREVAARRLRRPRLTLRRIRPRGSGSARRSSGRTACRSDRAGGRGPSRGNRVCDAAFAASKMFVRPSVRNAKPYVAGDADRAGDVLEVEPRGLVRDLGDDASCTKDAFRCFVFVQRYGGARPSAAGSSSRRAAASRPFDSWTAEPTSSLRVGTARVLEHDLHRPHAVDPPDGADTASVRIAERTGLRDVRADLHGRDGSGNAGTVIVLRPRYRDVLVTSPSAPPRLAPRGRGQERLGQHRRTAAPDQEVRRAREAVAAADGLAQRIGKVGGGGVLCQSVLTTPEAVSWKAIWPTLGGALGGLPRSCVVHSSRKALPFCSLTVTFSLVGVGL